jgi:hypothetical protein
VARRPKKTLTASSADVEEVGVEEVGVEERRKVCSGMLRCGEQAVSAATPVVLLPIVDLRELVEQKDALALRLADRLHDPDRVGVVLELFDEEAVVGGQHVCVWEEVVLARLLMPILLLELTLHAAQILVHRVLASQLPVVAVVVDSLVLLEVHRVHVVTDPPHVDPRHVPVGVRLGLAPAARSEDVVDGVAEGGTEPHRPLQPFPFAVHRWL